MRARTMLAVAAVWGAMAPATHAGMLLGHGRRSRCDAWCDLGAYETCQWHSVVRTVMVPTYVTELRTVQRVECRPEQRTRTFTVYQQVPETRRVTRQVVEHVLETRTRTAEYVVCRPVMREQTVEYTVLVPQHQVRRGVRRVCRWVTARQTRTLMVPETRTKTVNVRVCRTVLREQTQEYTVLVPHEEVRRGVRHECRLVPCTQTRTIREDHGCWVTQWCDEGCSDCRGRRRCCRRVWQPHIVERQVQVTCHRTQIVQVPCEYTVAVCRPQVRYRTVQVCVLEEAVEPREVAYTVCVPREEVCTVQRPEFHEEEFEYTVTVCRPETRHRTVQVCELVHETQTREVEYQVCVPRIRTQTVDMTAYRCVPVERTQTYQVLVPHIVEEQVPVRVCRLVPEQVTCRVPVYCGCGGHCD